MPLYKITWNNDLRQTGQSVAASILELSEKIARDESFRGEVTHIELINPFPLVPASPVQPEEKMIPLSWIRDLLNSHNGVDIIEGIIYNAPKNVTRAEAIAYALPQLANTLEARWDRENGS